MKRWISKYALSTGLYEAEGTISERGYFHTKMAMVISKGQHHATIEEAAIIARKMRDKRVASLEKQIASLKARVF